MHNPIIVNVYYVVCENTYHRVFWVNFQDLSEGCMGFRIVILTEVGKGSGKQINKHRETHITPTNTLDHDISAVRTCEI